VAAAWAARQIVTGPVAIPGVDAGDGA
jgi:hypothetical protein